MLEAFDGPTDAVVRCRACGAHALLQMLDWGERRRARRVFSLAGLRSADVAVYARDLERGSCDVGRAARERDALLSAAGPPHRLVACDLERRTLLASGSYPEGREAPSGSWQARLPEPSDGSWFGALGLSKGGV